MTKNRESLFERVYLPKILCLVIIAIIGFLAEDNFRKVFLYSLNLGYRSGIWNSLSLLPLLLILHLYIQKTLQKKILVPLYFLGIFLLLSPMVSIACLYIIFFIGLYYIERLSRTKKIIGPVLMSIITLMIFVPLSLYTFRISITPMQTYFLILFKSCFLMRILSWYIDRRVYERSTFDSLSEYVEFIFCPVFFIFPGQIQFFMYDYFHKSKASDTEKINAPLIIWLGVWGFFLMIIYSLMDQYFWRYFNDIPGWMQHYGFWSVQLTIGLYWLIVIYVQQTAGMAYQVSLARVMGYNLKYDMHWPLLARSPLDYLRRHSSYVKDYIVEMGLKPIALVSLRKGYSANLIFPIASIISYSFFISIQTGYRPDYNRQWVVTGVMIAFLVFAILISYFRTFIIRVLKLNPIAPETLLTEDSGKVLKHWNITDCLMWIMTIFVLSFYKMLLGIVK